jgi:hypothetical protein
MMTQVIVVFFAADFSGLGGMTSLSIVHLPYFQTQIIYRLKGAVDFL